MKSLSKISNLADEFIIKIAEYQCANYAPPDVDPDNLDWIDEETRQEIKYNQNNNEYIPFDKTHNPPGMIADEKTWNRAKKAVKPYAKKYKNRWAVTFAIYKMMHGRIKKK